MTKLTLDFANAQRAAFMPRHLQEGNYTATITKCEMVKSKSDNTDMILYSIECQGGIYPYYCKLVPTQLWKLRELLEAAGMKVPSKTVQVDPARVVGKKVTISVADDEYNGKLKSVIVSVAPYQPGLLEADGDVDEFDEDEEAPEEEAPKPKARRAPAKKADPEPEDTDFLDFDDLD